ncbi:MAG TPA: hypothetical protein VM328_04515 [Fimbriimonadaceae bacterium]|nr:hypothetical protein [Fimbriimonadaceae bacterium]
MIRLAPLDLAILAIFGLCILALGFSARLQDRSFLQFFTSGRTLSLPAFVAVLVSTWYGGILGIGESVSYFGLGTWLLLGVPYYVFAFVYALSLAPKVRGAAQLTIPERFELRYGGRSALVAAMLVFLLAVPAAHVLMLGVLLQTTAGTAFLPSMLVAALLGALFLYRGGLLADVRVALLSFVMMYVGFLVIALYCFARFPLTETWAAIEPATHRTFTGGASLLTILSFFILGAWTIADPGFHQRVASSASPSIGRRGVLVSIGFWFLFDALTVTTGMYALALMREMPEQTLEIFPRFGAQVLPPGLLALFLCGMAGTILTAMVGYTLVAGATFGREIVGRIRRSKEEQDTNLSRLGLFVAILVAVALASQIPSVVQLWYSWAGLVVGALLLPLLLSYRTQPVGVGREFVLWSMILSSLLSGAWLVYGIRTGNAYLNVRWLGEEFSLGTLAPGLVVSATVLGVGAALSRENSDDR